MVLCLHDTVVRIASFAKCKNQLGAGLTQIGLVKLGFLYDDSRHAVVCQSCSFSSDLSSQTTLQSITKEHLESCPNCPQHSLDENTQLSLVPDLVALGAVKELLSRLTESPDSTRQNDQIVDNTPENSNESSFNSKQGRNVRNVEYPPTANAEGRPNSTCGAHEDLPTPRTSVSIPVDSHCQTTDDSIPLATQSLGHDGGPELTGCQGAEGLTQGLESIPKKAGNKLGAKPKSRQNNNTPGAGDVAQRGSRFGGAGLGQGKVPDPRPVTHEPSRQDLGPLHATHEPSTQGTGARLAIEIPLRVVQTNLQQIRPEIYSLGISTRNGLSDNDLDKLERCVKHKESYNQVRIRSGISPGMTINDIERRLGVQNRSPQHTSEHGENSYQHAPHCIYYTGTEINLGDSPS